MLKVHHLQATQKLNTPNAIYLEVACKRKQATLVNSDWTTVTCKRCLARINTRNKQQRVAVDQTTMKRYA